ncbi:MAG: hypothetical protein ACXADH_05975 [Candidatus Kariarchaeaceae archaeon]|jgi:hypothetical protein
MPSRKITVGDIARTSEDILRNDEGSWAVTQTGINFITNEDKQHDISVQVAIPDEGSNLVQSVKITPRELENTALFPTDIQKFNALNSIKNEVEGKVYQDYVTSLETDITYEEFRQLGLDSPSDTMGVDFVYNFLDIEYERLLQTVENHNIIPSMYNILSNASVTTSTLEGDDLRGITAQDLQNNISSTVTRIRSVSGGPVQNFIDGSPQIVGNAPDKSVLQAFSDLSNQVITPENILKIKDFEPNKSLFPMHSEINIPFRTKTRFANAISDSGLSAVVIRSIFGAYPGSTTPSAASSQNLDYSYTYYVGQNAQIENFRSQTQIIDFDVWLNQDLPTWYSGKPLTDFWSFLGTEKQSELTSTNPSILEVGIRTIDLLVKIQNVVKQNVRSLTDIYRGEEAYSETLMYRVTKYLGQGIETPIQNFYFFNTTELNDFLSSERKLTLIDTQLKYGQTYTYSVMAYQIVVGAEYDYRDFEFNLQENSLEMNAYRSPSIKILEMPLFQSVGRVLSSPPLSPEIGFVPIKGQTNRIKMNLNTALGSEDLVPIPLNQQEILDYEQISLNQKRNDGFLTFQTDDHNRFYNIYRLSSAPSEYTDFENNLLTTVSTSGDTLEAGSATAIITQITNKKYYYIFRSVDVHGLLSNPSEVYEVELYDDGGAGYPIIRPYNFSQIDPTSPTKSARKIIQIIPRITQGYLNQSRSNLENDDGSLTVLGKDFALGLEDDSLFPSTTGYGVKTGKKFKIRLISKSTGKKVDINIDFNTNRVRSEIE